MDYGKFVRERREQLGLADAAVAKQVGITIHQYGDIEQHADEFVSNISQGLARKLCSALGVQLRTLLALPEVPQTQNRASAIHKSREAKALDSFALAERIGFAEEVIRSLESDDQFVDMLPINVVYELEDALGLERGSLIA